MMILISLTGLASGCAKISGDTYCDLTAPMYFDNDATVDYLLRNDRNLLTDIMVHNETNARICPD